MPQLLADVTSPAWAYLVLLSLLVVDAFVPIIPTQLLMITGGALTVYGGLELPLIIGVGALGVFTGDLACFLLGRGWERRMGPAGARLANSRRRAARFVHHLRQPGPMVILLCRFVPGGRMAACFHAGRSRYPARLFLTYAATAALGWAGYGGLVGHLGGNALTGSGWRLALVAAAAAAGFTTAGWLLTRASARRASGVTAGQDAYPDELGPTPLRAEPGTVDG